MPEGLLIAGFPRIVRLPLEGKVPQRGGEGTSGMKESGKERLKSTMKALYPPLRVNLYKERSPIKNHSRPFLWKGQTSEARRGWHSRE